MRASTDDLTKGFIQSHRVARLATADAGGYPSVVPICYAFDGECFFSPIDEKPKVTDFNQLKRLRNIRANPRVSLVIDDYSEDWSRLTYVMINGVADVLEPDAPGGEHRRGVELLREKYDQYLTMAIDRRPLIKVTPTRIKRWAPSEPDGQT
jgi:PPOX class probable F420-dependent enzyme